VLLTPIIPETCQKIFEQIGTTLDTYESIEAFGGIEAGKKVVKGDNLFARIDEEKMMAEIAEERAAAETAAKVVEKSEEVPQINIDTFMGVELRCAKVLECEKVKKSKKLLRLILDLGYEKRQVASGIAQFYEPEALIGKNVVLVANLAPVTLCGVESHGMILACGEESPKVVFLSDETKPGERIR